MKRKFRLTENILRNIIAESIKSILNEGNNYYTMEINLPVGLDEIFNTENDELVDVDDNVTVVYDYDEGCKDDYVLNIPGTPDNAELMDIKCTPEQIQKISAVTGLDEKEINSKIFGYVDDYWEYYYKENAIDAVKSRYERDYEYDPAEDY